MIKYQEPFWMSDTSSYTCIDELPITIQAIITWIKEVAQNYFDNDWEVEQNITTQTGVTNSVSMICYIINRPIVITIITYNNDTIKYKNQTVVQFECNKIPLEQITENDLHNIFKGFTWDC